MRERARGGFNVIELAVVTAVVTLLALAFLPLLDSRFFASGLTLIGSRGRDIYIAIVGANTEREALGLPPVWPADKGFYANAVAGDISAVSFTNSTEYFRCLYDEAHAGTDQWKPWVAGFDYSKLAGNGVSKCEGGRLTPEHNIWTIAKNVREDLPDVVPVLVTRNIDATSLAAAVSEKDAARELRFSWPPQSPCGTKGLVAIRKGGSIFKARKKNMVYSVIYGGKHFDLSCGGTGGAARAPFGYLTPAGTAVPGTSAPADGWVRATRFLQTVGRDLAAVFPLGLLVGLGYLALAGVCGWMRVRGLRAFRLFDFSAVFWAAHGLATFFWCAGFFGPGLFNVSVWWPFVALALLAESVGLLNVVRTRKGDQAAVRRGMRWLLVVPLLAGGVVALPVVVFLVLIFCLSAFS